MKPKFNFRLAGGLVCLTLLAILIFRAMKELSVGAYIAVIAVYSAVTLAAAVWYILYNRGLAGTKLTSDMLPKEWSAEQKKEFMDDYTARRQKSKKALLILVPMIATFFLEVLDIYVLQGILSYLQK